MFTRRKLIFEAPHLPGGIIFTMVCNAFTCDEEVEAHNAKVKWGLRFKGSEPTNEPESRLTFAVERFDLGRIVEAVVGARSLSESELERIETALAPARRAAQLRRVEAEQREATPNWATEMQFPAAEWCKGPHPTGKACSYCGPIIESHVAMKSAGLA